MATIDPDFKQKLEITGKHEEYGYDIWGEFNPPEKLGIHGSHVAVDFDICIGDGACVDVCPEEVFEWVDYEGHAASTEKAALAGEDDVDAGEQFCELPEDDLLDGAIEAQGAHQNTQGCRRQNFD